MRQERAQTAADNLNDRIRARLSPGHSPAHRLNRRHYRVEVRATHRTEYRNQHCEDSNGGSSVRQQRNSGIPVGTEFTIVYSAVEGLIARAVYYPGGKATLAQLQG